MNPHVALFEEELENCLSRGTFLPTTTLRKDDNEERETIRMANEEQSGQERFSFCGKQDALRSTLES
jgi:hypothetical protein